jgi:hypothetical protein
MSSIIEGYKVVAPKEDVVDGQNRGLAALDVANRVIKPLGEQEPTDLDGSVINKPAESLEDKAYHELVAHLGGSVKAIDNDTHELTIMTGSASAIKIKVVGYEHPELVNVAKAREDAVAEDLPPVETPRTTAPDSSLEATDQVAAVRQFNTDQYMKHSRLNPKKFG